MDQLHELKKWIELGFESSPTTQSIINKINTLTKNQMEKETEQTKQKIGEWKNDDENYQAMAVPFKNNTELESATVEFFKEVSQLRKKYKITDIVLTAKSTYFDDKGEEHEGIMIHRMGNNNVHPVMAGFTFAELKKEVINKLNEIANLIS